MASEKEATLRTVEEVNTVRHLNNTAEYDAAAKAGRAAAWLDKGSSEDVVKPVKDGLFIVHGPSEGSELAMGLVHIMSSSLEARDYGREKGVPSVQAAWFRRTSHRSFKWPQNPLFQQWPKPAGKQTKRVPVWIRADSLLLQVKKADLTEATRGDEMLVAPRLRKPSPSWKS